MNCRFSIVVFVVAVLVGSAHSQMITNGSFEAGLDMNWGTTVTSGATATFSISTQSPKQGTNELDINYTEQGTDSCGVSLSSTITLQSDSVYLLVFWARESEEFQYETNQPDYVAYPDFARMLVTITGNNGYQNQVVFDLRQGYTTYQLPFKTTEQEVTISFYPQTVGRHYYIDDVRLLDQSDHQGIDVLNTYKWNNKRSTTDATWLAGDNDVSLALPDGRTLWFFNDSFDGAPNDTTINRLASLGTFIRNACVLENLDGSLQSYGSTDRDEKGQRAFFEIIPGNEVYNNDGSQSNFYWVGDAIITGDTIRTYLVEVYGERRSAVAEFSYPQLQLLDIKPQASFCYGYETMISQGDSLYLYKHNEENESGVHVARTVPRNLTGVDMWEFWNGTAWVSDPAQSASVIDYTIPDAVVKLQDGNYAMVNGLSALSIEVQVRFAENPQGPWTIPQTVYTRPDDWQYWAYMPNIHGQLDNGNYSISYSSNSWLPLFFSSWSFADKYWYRQRYIQVDLVGLSPYTHETAVLDQCNDRAGVIRTITPVQVGSSLHLRGASADALLEVFDLTGKKILSGRGNSIKCTGLSQSVYVVRVQDRGTTMRATFVNSGIIQ